MTRDPAFFRRRGIFSPSPQPDAAALLENIGQLGTGELVFVALCVAAAIYFAVEGVIGDVVGSEHEIVSGKVTDSRFNFGEDSPGFTVEFRAESGQMHMIEDVRHPLRALKVGETVMVRYRQSRPDRAKLCHSPLTSTILTIFKVTAALTIAYAFAARGG